MRDAGRIVIVGASLAGLMTALALSRLDVPIILLERSDDTDRTGAALQVDYGLLERLTGRRGLSASLAAGVQTWRATHAGLRAAIEQFSQIEVRQRARVVEAGQEANRAWAVTADGERIAGDIVIGADGYQSVVRRAVSPERPDAVYAGYLAWVGVAPEAALQSRFPGGLDMLSSGPYHMLGFPLPARDGSRGTGQREIGWAWYDAGHDALLRASGSLDGSVVRRSLRPANIPEATLDQLADEARRHWPNPWREAMLHNIASRDVLGTPVIEYLPDRLVRGRVALVGDAAHVATPMTGTGFAAAAADAIAIGAALARDDAEEALQRYETARLEPARALVQGGQRFSRGFVAGARS